MSEEIINEGWQAEKHYNQRVYHYIVDSFSLCRRLGFYFGDLMPHKGEKGREVCGLCFKRVEKRVNKDKNEK
jgi:hypothetical protein